MYEEDEKAIWWINMFKFRIRNKKRVSWFIKVC